jgi:hypothetical protein
MYGATVSTDQSAYFDVGNPSILCSDNPADPVIVFQMTSAFRAIKNAIRNHIGLLCKNKRACREHLPYMIIDGDARVLANKNIVVTS